MNELKTISLAFRDQLRTSISGRTGYNNRLRNNQVELGFKMYEETDRYPFICIAAVSELLKPITVDDRYQRDMRIEIFGYIKEQDDTLEKALELQSDIEAAIWSDTTIGGRVVGLSVVSNDVSAAEQIGVCAMVATCRFHYEP